MSIPMNLKRIALGITLIFFNLINWLISDPLSLKIHNTMLTIILIVFIIFDHWTSKIMEDMLQLGRNMLGTIGKLEEEIETLKKKK